MFTQSAHVYDAIMTRAHDFARLSHQVDHLIRQHKRTSAMTLLDVACGTGLYLHHLRHRYDVAGLDIERGMLALAAVAAPGVPLHQGDLADFDLGPRFGAVVCLGSSIGYVESGARLRQALATFARHTLPGGVVLVEPWFGPDAWEDGRVTVDTVDQPGLKIARMLASGREGQVATLAIHYLVGRAGTVTSAVEHHRLGLFADAEYRAAFHAAGLDVAYDAGGLLGRGLYIGTPREPAATSGLAESGDCGEHDARNVGAGTSARRGAWGDGRAGR